MSQDFCTVELRVSSWGGGGGGEPGNSGSLFRNSAKMSLMSTQVSCTHNWNLNPKNVENWDTQEEFVMAMFDAPGWTERVDLETLVVNRSKYCFLVCRRATPLFKPLSRATSPLLLEHTRTLLFWREELYVIASSAFQKEFSANLQGVSIHTVLNSYACWSFRGWTTFERPVVNGMLFCFCFGLWVKIFLAFSSATGTEAPDSKPQTTVSRPVLNQIFCFVFNKCDVPLKF